MIPLLIGLVLAFHALADLDIWLHDRAGSDILHGAGLPRRNLYSFTAPEHPWLDHEWLFQVGVTALGSAYEGEARAVPWNVLRLLLSGALLVILLAQVGEGRLQGVSRGDRSGSRLAGPRPAALVLPALAMLGVLWPRLVLRPELLSLTLFTLAVRWVGAAYLPSDGATNAATAWALLFSPRTPSGRVFWLTLLWAQCHGFYMLAPALWLLAMLSAPIERWLLRLWTRDGRAVAQPARTGSRSGTSAAQARLPLRGLAPMLVALVAGALTPNGLPGLMYPLRAMGQLGSDLHLEQTISELAPLASLRGELGTTLLVFNVSMLWGILWCLGSLGRVPIVRLVVFVAAVAAALQNQRNLGFYAVTFFLLHTGYDGNRPWAWSAMWRHVERTLSTHATWSFARRWAGFGAVAAAAAVGALWLPSLLDNGFYLREGVSTRTGLGVTPGLYPLRVAAAARTRSAGGTARIANNVDAASILVNTRAGQVYIDGRTEAYPAAVWREYRVLKEGGDAALDVLARRRVDAVVLAHRSSAMQGLIRTLLESASWRLVEADEAGVLFVPAGPEAGAPGSPTATGATPTEAGDSAVLTAAAERLLSDARAAREGVRTADRCLALGTLLRLGGDNPGAERLYEYGIAAHPAHPLLRHNLGNLLLARGDPGAALAHFRHALAFCPRLVDTRINEGVALFQLGKLAEAERAFRRALRFDPQRAGVWSNLGEVLARRGDRRGALRAYEKALSLQPGDPRLRQRAAALQQGE